MVELIVVLAVIATLLLLAWPRYVAWIDRSRDVVLQENLRVVRIVLERYYEDRGRYPDSLEELVAHGYLKAIPVDPVTERTDTWILLPPTRGEAGRVADLHSGSEAGAGGVREMRDR